AGDPGGVGAVDRRAHRVRHRPPAVDAAQGVPAVRDRGWAAGGKRQACGADGEDEREVSEAVRDAGGAGVNWEATWTQLRSGDVSPTKEIGRAACRERR